MKLQEPFRYNENGSHCPLSNHDFAESVATDIYIAVEDYYQCILEIECYTPPYNPPLSTESARCGGFLIIHLHTETLSHACIGIEFGCRDKEGQPLRATMDVEEWRTDPSNPLYAGVYAANFDEAWRIVCMLGLMLDAAAVKLSYGN